MTNIDKILNIIANIPFLKGEGNDYMSEYDRLALD